MYQNELYQLIYDIFNMIFIIIFLISLLITYVIHIKHELQALQIDGYQTLRLKETTLRIKKATRELELKHDLKYTKLQNKK